MRENRGRVVEQEFTIWVWRVVWIVEVGKGKEYESIVESLHGGERPHRSSGALSEYDVEQPSASDVS